MTRDDMEALRDWWDGLREVEQFAAYVAEKSNADGLASTGNLGVEEAIARCQQMLAQSEAAADREVTRLRGLLAEERAAHAATALGAAFDRDALDEALSAAQDIVEALDDPLSATYPRSIALDALRVLVKRVSTKRASIADDFRVLGLTIDELRTAVATADQYHPQWRRSSRIGPSSPGE